MLNTFVFCLPARWLWSEQGVFKLMGVVDLAGSCGVNLVGGAGALVGGAAGCVQISDISDRYVQNFGGVDDGRMQCKTCRVIHW